MKRHMLTLVAILLAWIVSVPWVADTRAQTEHPAANSGPRIEFETLEHDFGHALAGQPLKASFGFKNVGDEMLVIESVKGG